MPTPNTKLRSFRVTFRSTDSFEMKACKAFSMLPYGNGKRIFLQLLRVCFEDCDTAEAMVLAINDAIDNTTSPRIINGFKHHMQGVEYVPAVAKRPRTAEAMRSAQQWKSADVLAG